MIWLFLAVVLLMLAEGVCMAGGKPTLIERASTRVAADKARWVSTGVYAAISLLFLALSVGAVRLAGG